LSGSGERYAAILDVFSARGSRAGLGLATPEGSKEEVSAGSSDEVSRRDLFGGLIHEYRAVAA